MAASRIFKNQGLSYGPETIKVYLDGRHIGEIREVEKGESMLHGITIFGYQYFPKGSKTGGEIFDTLTQCKGSLEAP